METNNLINRIKREDERYASIAKTFQIVYWVLVPIYLVLITKDIITKSPVAEIAGSFCFLLGLVVFAILFRIYYFEYKSVDYGQPTLEMLKKAAYRYKPFQSKLWITFIAVLLIGTGLSLSGPFADFLKTQIFFWGAMTAALIIGLIVWWIRYKPLRDNMLRMIREIEEETS